MPNYIKKIYKYIIQIKKATNLICSASKKYFILYMILNLVVAVIPYAPLFLWRQLLNMLTEYILNHNGDLIREIIIFTTGYCIFLLFQGVINNIMTIVSYKYNDEIDFYLDNLLIDKISGADMSFFDSSEMADRLKNTSKYMRSTTQNMVISVFNMIQGVIRLFLSLILIYSLSIWMIPIIIVLSIPTVILDRKSKADNYKFNKEQNTNQRKLGYYKELFFSEAKQEMKLYNLTDFFEHKYKIEWNKWRNANNKLNIKNCIRNCITMLIVTGVEVIAYIFSIAKLTAHIIGVGDVTYYVSIATRFRSDFMSVTSTFNGFVQQSVQLDDVTDFIELKSQIECGGILIPSARPRVEFQNVSFKYPSAENYVLHNCSFVINPGEVFGLVGLNGAGKSTIVKLLLRFYDPCEGKILIDGIDAREYDLVKLRRCFGVLFQDYCTYSFTLRENIAIADIDRLNNNTEILDACEKSNVTDFIGDWENGIDEDMTRRFNNKGKELSGGQWQRVSLARAFFRKAPIVLLDEPSAALDPVAEHDIFKKFSQLSDKNSAVLISHRLSSITLCDKILVLEDGHIIEQGSHKELIESKGRYAYLFNLQASKYM